jgi:tRNA(Ile)-lysidine synthase
MLQRINSFIANHNLIPNKSTIIVGLSGGPDSVFLLHFLQSLQEGKQLTLIAAHLDHEWRSDSANDAEFCKTLCAQLAIPFIHQKLSQLGFTHQYSGSKEEYGRRARRFFFEQTAQQYHAQLIALAHHQDDQQETFFIRLLRGSSLTGLTGMQPQQDAYIRPLLCVSKQEIVDYLDKQNNVYLIDPSNISDDFLRNRIRNNVIPALRLSDTRFDTTFATTLERLQETEQFLQKLTQQTFDTLFNNQKLDYKQVLELEPVLQYRILLHWLCHEQVPFTPTQSFFDEMIRFLQQTKNNCHAIHHQWSIQKIKNNVFIDKKLSQLR